MPAYVVRTEQFGEIRKLEDNIKAARLWAKRAFPRQSVVVFREFKNRYCDDCRCAPCCCMVRADA